MGMYRDEDDLQLLAELAGVLDTSVTAAGLTPGTFVVLRHLATRQQPEEVTAIAESLRAKPDEVAELCGRLVDDELARAGAGGVAASNAGRALSADVEDAANEAMREYVLDRPHTATVYGLVAAMQTGRFTVVDLLEFLAEGPSDEDAPADGV